MSLAPASSRGFFLNARLAVNGIQCAARSFGTLTAGRAGLLSSIGCLLGFGLQGFARHAISFAWLRERTLASYYAGQMGGFRDAAVSRTRCGILHAAPQSRDRTKRRRSLRPRLCSAPRRKERRAALRPGHGATPPPPVARRARARCRPASCLRRR